MSVLVGVLALVWLLLTAAYTVFSDVPDAELARTLQKRVVVATATEVREELSRRNHRRELEVTFTTADGERITARATGFSSNLAVYEARDGWEAEWRPGTYQYAAPLEVVYDPRDPERVMVRDDVAGHADGDRTRRGLVNLAIGGGALAFAVLVWLAAVVVRVRRRR
ncbi:DUF3592 domain-containing protein [Blastococcus sp. TBT05-19]|uniref:DUF3592 domain-containing protein n=1 Tax=Blastococcus sp. TBT05-19 TaxID=2250581 RepID=UPI001314DC34|nr:DUF3592 domain-containing protein [Blastococcus sp. TBT05-19]